MKKLKLLPLFSICFFLSNAAYSAQENTSAADLLFGNEEKITKPVDIPILWNTKSELISAASNGKTVNIDSDNQEIINSFRKILANEYNTPVPIPKNDGSNSIACDDAFRPNAINLLDHITKVSLAQVGDNPPDFIGTPSENSNETGRSIFTTMNYYCTQGSWGNGQIYPFVNSLASLMKEYRETMNLYAQKLRQEKIAAYNQSVINEAELKTKKLAAEVKIKQSEGKTTQSEKAKAEFEKSEQAKEKACKNSLAFERYILSDDIQYNLNAAQSARQDIAKEKEAGKVSGYVNATTLNKLGRLVVFHEDRANSSFAEYRKNGGTATSARSVEVPKNPCL